MPRRPLSPILAAALMLGGFFGLAAAARAETQAVTPNLSVPVPNVALSSIQAVKSFGVPWIAEYVYGIFQYSVGIAAALAATMMVIGGINWMLGDPGTGKKRIQQALIGLAIAAGSYLILATVNPALVNLQEINVQAIAADRLQLQLFDELGTGDPSVSDEAADLMAKGFVTAPYEGVVLVPGPGGKTTEVQAGAYPTGGGPAAEPAGGRVDVSGIGYDRDLKPLENLQKYCTNRSTARASGVTREQKEQFLVKAVLGFIEVCVKQRKCVYGQGGATVLPNGPAMANWLPNFSIPQLEAHGHPAEDVFSGFPDCLARWKQTGNYAPGGSKNPAKLGGGALVNQSTQCDAVADAAMKQYYLDKVNDAGLFVGDCGTTVRAILSCSGIDWQDIPTKAPNGQRTGYPDSRNLGTHDSDPRMVLATAQKDNLDAKAAEKGGMKFGDIVYTCCGGAPGSYSAHWMMYVGGRPEIPYSYIEMGGDPSLATSARSGGASVEDWGPANGIVLKKQNVSLESFVRAKFAPQRPTWCTPGKDGCPSYIQPKAGVENGLVFVWRPFE